MTRHRYIVLGWLRFAEGRTRLVGVYRTRLGARVAAWRHRRRGPEAHAWVEGPGDGDPRLDLRYDPLAVDEDGPCP